VEAPLNQINRVVRYIIFSLVLTLMGVVFIAPATAATTAAPKVVFMGDWVTLNWEVSTINPAWTAVGGPEFNSCYTEPVPCWGGSSTNLLADMPGVIATHPAIIHIMMGVVDDDGTAITNGAECCIYPYSTSQFLINLDSMVKQAKAANIPVILGIEPSIFAFGAVPLQPLNSIIASYGALHSIPVINYADALCKCVDSVGGVSLTYLSAAAGSSIVTPSEDFVNAAPLIGPPGYKENSGPAPTAAGYVLMTQMVQAVINTLNARLVGGYLSNVTASSSTLTPQGVNTIGLGVSIQFTPFGEYSNGVKEVLINDNYAGETGTWASSDPLVMYVSQQGLAESLSTGTTIITYTSPTGVRFSEWIMYVNN
jgi:hypothetical protein